MLRLLSITTVLLLSIFQLQGQTPTYTVDPAPPQGYVPDASTAVAIAEAVWIPLYGPRSVSRRRPYRAFLRDNAVWVVHGTGAAGAKEEVPTIEISKQDGRVLKTSGKAAMQEYAKHDTLTVFVRIPDAQHEQYIIQHGRRIVLTTRKGESFIGSFKMPIDPEAGSGSGLNILIFRKSWLGFRRNVVLGVPLYLEHRYLILNRNPYCKKKFAMECYYADKKPVFF